MMGLLTGSLYMCVSQLSRQNREWGRPSHSYYAYIIITYVFISDRFFFVLNDNQISLSPHCPYEQKKNFLISGLLCAARNQ